MKFLSEQQVEEAKESIGAVSKVLTERGYETIRPRHGYDKTIEFWYLGDKLMCRSEFKNKDGVSVISHQCNSIQDGREKVISTIINGGLEVVPNN